MYPSLYQEGYIGSDRSIFAAQHVVGPYAIVLLAGRNFRPGTRLEIRAKCRLSFNSLDGCMISDTRERLRCRSIAWDRLLQGRCFVFGWAPFVSCCCSFWFNTCDVWVAIRSKVRLLYGTTFNVCVPERHGFSFCFSCDFCLERIVKSDHEPSSIEELPQLLSLDGARSSRRRASAAPGIRRFGTVKCQVTVDACSCWYTCGHSKSLDDIALQTCLVCGDKGPIRSRNPNRSLAMRRRYLGSRCRSKGSTFVLIWCTY